MPWTSKISTAAALAALACLLCLTVTPAAVAGRSVAETATSARTLAPGVRSANSPTPTDGYGATLEQCTPSALAADRSVTFTGEMYATPATQRMGMKIELLERLHGEQSFHVVMAPSLGVWRAAEAGVKIYRYVKQITNLSAPAVYRAVVHFRWLGDKGRVIKRAELRTAKCVQPLLTPPQQQPSGEQAT